MRQFRTRVKYGTCTVEVQNKLVTLKPVLQDMCYYAVSYLLEELVEHQIVDLARTRPVQFDDLLVLRPVAIQGPELATRIPKQHQEVFRLGPGNLLQHLLLGVAIHHPREDTVLDGIEDDAPIRLGRRLFVKLGT